MKHIFTKALLLFANIHTASSLQTTSLLTNTQWKLNLDVGLQPGTWMPKRFPGWAESGARLGLDIEVQFTSKPSSQRETLVGPKEQTFELDVIGDSSVFVSEKGQETVDFTTGGWCIQRPTGDIRNAAGSLVKPEGLLRFWLDCPNGAKRRDVEIFPNTRIFFTTGVWDDPSLVEEQQQQYTEILKQMETMADNTRDLRRESEDKNVFQNLFSFRKLVQDSKEYDDLYAKKERYEKEMPPIGASLSSNGVKIAPTGSLVIKGNSVPDWLPGSEYLILGTFSTTALDP
mmetsp:Transcript_13593/g.19922  ORF Transcript_13593/g.19922 Transcript_13593/m.19922 type:complete len:287 (-) Transcript_13593:319-1179(-)